MALTAKQRAFIREYRVCGNATEAALKAGYSKKGARQQGSALLTNPAIANELQEAEAKVAEKCEVDREYVLRGLKAEAELDDNRSSERTAALVALGKAVDGGIFTDKREVDVGKKLEDILTEAGEED